MGLSDQERYNNIISTINALTKKVDKLNDYYVNLTNNHLKIIKLIKQLWPAFLGSSSNSGYWLCGGEESSDHMSDSGVMQSAFESALSSKESIEQDFWTSNKLDIEHEFVMEIFSYSEYYFYNVTRYNDEFSKRLNKTTKIFSKILGVCYDEFSRDDLYVKNWMVSNLKDKIHRAYDDDSVLKSWIEKHYSENYINPKHLKANKLKKLFVKYRKYNKLSVYSKVKILLHISNIDNRALKELLEVIKGAVSEKGMVKLNLLAEKRTK